MRFSSFLILILSKFSSFSSIKSSKLSDVLKIEVIDPIRNEKNVNPMNSKTIENNYSAVVTPV